MMHDNKTVTAYRLTLKDEILDAAFAAFATQGIKAVTMDDIAMKLSISKRTLYEIYATKEILLFEGIKKYKVRTERIFLERIKQCDNVIDIIVDFYMAKAVEYKNTSPLFYSDLQKYPKLLGYLEQERKNGHERFKKFFKRGVEEGFFRPDVNDELLVAMFDGLGEYLQRKELYRKYSFDELFFNIFIVTLRGISTDKGVEELDKRVF